MADWLPESGWERAEEGGGEVEAWVVGVLEDEEMDWVEVGREVGAWVEVGWREIGSWVMLDVGGMDV